MSSGGEPGPGGARPPARRTAARAPERASAPAGPGIDRLAGDGPRADGDGARPRGGDVQSLSLGRELARKALHLTSSVVPLAYAAGMARGDVLSGLVALLVVAVVVELVRHRAGIVRALFHRTAGPLLREHEHHRWSGATWMLLAYVLVTWLAPREAAVAAMWAVAVGDAAAAVVGRWLGRTRPGAAGKSLEGSVACFAATAAGALLVAGLGPVASVAAGAAAAVAEWPHGPLDDNVRVAGAVALAVTLMGRVAAPVA